MKTELIGYMTLDNFAGTKPPQNMVVLRDFPTDSFRQNDPALMQLRRVCITVLPQTLAETTWDKLTDEQRGVLAAARIFKPEHLDAKIADGTLEAFFDGIGEALDDLINSHRIKMEQTTP